MKNLPRAEFLRIASRIDVLSQEPRPFGVQKLKGSRDEYRLRQGVYRILYRIDDAAKCVFVYSVAHRKDACR